MKQTKMYVLAYYVKQPLVSGSTRFAGYVKDSSNVSFQEQIIVASKIKDRDYQTAGIILDPINKKVVKNTWKPNSDFASLWSYFTTNYESYLKPLNEIVNPVQVEESVSNMPVNDNTQTTTAPSSSTISS